MIKSDDSLASVLCEDNIWTNPGLLFNGPLGNFNEILNKMKYSHLNMPSAKWRPFLQCVNVIKSTHLFQYQFCKSHLYVKCHVRFCDCWLSQYRLDSLNQLYFVTGGYSDSCLMVLMIVRLCYFAILNHDLLRTRYNYVITIICIWME